ncbi:hypothetical protein BT63DRAFT_475403 [Microthyrium microscopicum]|uniref:Uncharacterized protein n=1 Tax=Microthyrium microscopicum TaxID=703497 RepID=A0A6A6UKQ2_9PEZI|nr:hypothetical protein BT63DRAFT_475403 [Microthyrium microscopicum]
MATTRLRRALAPPTDDPTTADLDEQEQAELITSLRTHDARSSAIYRALFALVPVLAGLLVLSSARSIGLAMTLGSLSSLAATVYTLYYLPLPPIDEGKGKAKAKSEKDGPLETWLMPLNAMLACVLTISGVAGMQNGLSGWEDGEGMLILPFVVFIIVMVGRATLAPIDVDGLEKLKYNYKGA